MVVLVSVVLFEIEIIVGTGVDELTGKTEEEVVLDESSATSTVDGVDEMTADSNVWFTF